MNAIELLLDSNRGIYIPQYFAEDIDVSKFRGIDAEDLAVLREGPDAEWYWEAWENVLNGAEYQEKEFTYQLHHDGDLWLICSCKMSKEEHLAFFGEYPY